MIKVCVVLCVLSLQESLADEKFRNILYRIEEFKRQLDRVGWQRCTCVRVCVRTYMHACTNSLHGIFELRNTVRSYHLSRYLVP